jgi:hypothetical protein
MTRSSREALRFSIRIIREPAFVPMTPRKQEICRDFGIPPRESPQTLVDGLPIELTPGTIVFVGGPSGSGKTSVLREIAERTGQYDWVGRDRNPTQRAVIDTIAPRAPLSTALEILTACGLGEPRLWIRRCEDLSDGERFRAALARTVGRAISSDRRAVIICDEFTAILHRRAARAISYNLRKLVSRHRLMLVVAATHDDVVEDLQPDRVIRLGGLCAESSDAAPRRRDISLRRRCVVQPGSVRDYRLFGPMHYRHRDGLGFVDKVFLLREGTGGDPLGILVFAHAPRELTLRNRATDGRFVRNIRRLNRELRILRRLVMHPDVRGCGLGHWFVKKTLPRVGVRFIECLAVMGAVNPVFERAGMNRIGRCPLPPGRMKLLERMRDWNLDPFSPGFPKQIARYPRVRRLVEQTIMDWVSALHRASAYDAHGRPPLELTRAFRQLIGAPPIYYLWDRDRVYPRRDALPDLRGEFDSLSRPRPRRPMDDEPTATQRNKDRSHPDGSPAPGRRPTRRGRAER